MKVLALIVGVLILASLVWTTGDLHYGTCIAAAQARSPLVPIEPGLPSQTGDAFDNESKAVARQLTAVNHRSDVDRCEQLLHDIKGAAFGRA